MSLVWDDDSRPVTTAGTEIESSAVRPLKATDERFKTYADALTALAAPRLLEDRPCYRLLEVSVADGTARLTMGRGTYFDVINVSEGIAHELAASVMAGSPQPHLSALPFRSLIGDPRDTESRAVIPAISALTIRQTAPEIGSFVLHWRDSAKVAHGGGLYQVMPVGTFQPSVGRRSWMDHSDFDLWRSMAHEYSEEFLGLADGASEATPVDYDQWPFYQALDEARRAGLIRTHFLGLGVDPLSFATDLLVCVVIADDAFDELFDGLVAVNAEGSVVTQLPDAESVTGIPFTEESIERFARREPMQAAGAALLHLAWQHRGSLLAA